MSCENVNLNTNQRFSLQNGTILPGITASGARFPLNSSGISIFDPNDYLGPTFSPFFPIQTITENFRVIIDGDWSGKVKPGDQVEILRGSISNEYTVQRSVLLLGTGGTYSNPRTLLNFSTDRNSVNLLDPFIGTAGYTGSAPDTFITLSRKIENPNSSSSLLRDFSFRLYEDPRFSDSFLAEISWEIDPSVKATRLRWRSTPRVSFQSTLSFSVTTPGVYNTIPPATVISSTGRSAQVQLSGEIFLVSIDSGGSGYTTASIEAIGGGGTGASFSVTLSGGSLNNITIVSGGTGYTSVPTLSLTGDGTGGAVSVATMQVNSIDIVQQGGGYLSPPSIEIDNIYVVTPGVFSSTLSLSNEGRIDYLRVVDGGSGYTGASVTITGSPYSEDATATAQVQEGAVTNIVLTSRGYGYTASPVVTITPSGASGSGAIAVANVDLYSQWVYEDPLYTEKKFTIEGLKYNVPYEVEILVSPDEKFRGILSYSSPLSFLYLK